MLKNLSLGMGRITPNHCFKLLEQKKIKKLQSKIEMFHKENNPVSDMLYDLFNGIVHVKLKQTERGIDKLKNCLHKAKQIKDCNFSDILTVISHHCVDDLGTDLALIIDDCSPYDIDYEHYNAAPLYMFFILKNFHHLVKIENGEVTVKTENIEEYARSIIKISLETLDKAEHCYRRSNDLSYDEKKLCEMRDYFNKVMNRECKGIEME